MPLHTITPFKLLRVVLVAMILATFGAGLYLIAASIILAIQTTGGVQEGSRAFFMSVSGLTLTVFGVGFVMMTRELSNHIKSLSPA